MDDHELAELELAALRRVAQVMTDEAARLPDTSPVGWELTWRSERIRALMAEAA